MDQQPPTPILDRMSAPHDCDGAMTTHSQLIGAFLDHLNEQGIQLAKWGHEMYSDPVYRHELPAAVRGEMPEGMNRNEWLDEVIRWVDREGSEDRLIPIGLGPKQLLEQYFGIDGNAVEKERRALLDHLNEYWAQQARFPLTLEQQQAVKDADG